MKTIKATLSCILLAATLLLSSFSPKQESSKQESIMHHAVIINYAWYTPSGQFVAWSTLVNAEFVSGDDTNPANGTLNLLGYTGGGPGVPPSGTLVYKLYSHP